LDFIKNKESFMMSEDHEYNESEDEAIVTAAKAGGTADEVLMGMLRDLRKVKKIRRASICGISRSLRLGSQKYPFTRGINNAHGVGRGKAKNMVLILKLISRYVADNDIIRPEDLVVKSTESTQSINYILFKTSTENYRLMISLPKGLKMDDLIMEQIVCSGTKLNIKYWIDDVTMINKKKFTISWNQESDNIKCTQRI
jgi:ATP-dependent DNA helicase RecQ